MSIPVPDPDLTPEGIIQRARDMVPVLRERQELCEAQGRLPEETNDQFVKAGFYRILQPRRFGGYEFGLPTFVRVMMEIGRGCPSSAWVLALTAGHAHMFSAFFPEKAQLEVYGTTGEFRGPSSTPPRVTATPVDGGFRASGAWEYASGIDISTHFIGGIGVVREGPDGPRSEPRMAVLNRADYTIVDDWDVVGMRGTGSRRVVVADVFIPDYRTIAPPRDAVNARNAPGRGLHPNPFYVAGRLTSILLLEMAAVAVGVARGALDIYEADLCARKMAYPPYSSRSELPEYQRHYGDAWATIRVAEAAVLKIADDYVACCQREVDEGVPFSDEMDSQLQLLEQYATKMASDAVDLMFKTSGTSAAKTGSRLQRYFRDMSVLMTHMAAQIDRGAEAVGRVHFTGQLAPAAVLARTPL
ncbi:MAG TPA: acyl-CoA dehydrogenase family protein [Chloroflexota bacterium]|nr:acyl-CoA dehydrogenase family protein [Chloroflexota bacterium]